MSDSSNILPELIEASRDGGEFYAEAAESVKDAELSKLFKRMARAKADLAQELANEVVARPIKVKAAAKSAAAKAPAKATAKSAAKAAPAKGWVGEIHAVYRDLRPGMKAIRQDQVTRIEETENQLLGRIQQVRHDKENSYVVRVLAMQYETHARALGEALRARKRRLTAAAAQP
jgi:rubrerythrin